MRLAASLLTAAALLVGVAPAAAYSKTIQVPVLDCYVSVETFDLSAGVNRRTVRVERDGEVALTVRTDC